MQVSFGERSYRIGIFTWAVIGAVSYWVLPWFAFEYGLFDATMDEYWATLGWKSHPVSMFVPLSLLFFIPICRANWSRQKQGRVIIALASIVTLLLIADFVIPNRSMGLGAGVIRPCFPMALPDSVFFRGMFSFPVQLLLLSL